MRAMFLRESIASALGDKRADERANRIWQKLTGRYEPDLEARRKDGESDRQIKESMKLFRG